MRAAVKGRPLLCCRFFTLGSQRPLSSRRACGGSCFPRSHEAGELDLRWVDDLERFCQRDALTIVLSETGPGLRTEVPTVLSGYAEVPKVRGVTRQLQPAEP